MIVLEAGITQKNIGLISIEEPVCNEGEQRCTGTNLEECQNNAWVVIEENSLECGYDPGSAPLPKWGYKTAPLDPWPDETNVYGYVYDWPSGLPIEGWGAFQVFVDGVKVDSQKDGLFWVWHLPYKENISIKLTASGYKTVEGIIRYPTEINSFDQGSKIWDLGFIYLEKE